MTREVFVMRNGHMVPKRLAQPLAQISGRSVHVISDTMAPTKHMATGRIHDSKSKFRADTKAAGCVEVGTDPAALRAQPRPEPSMSEVVNDVRRSIQELKSR